MDPAARKTVEALLRQAQALRVARRAGDLDACLAQARQVAVRDAVAAAMIGDFCSIAEDYRGALAAYEQALRLEPSNARFRYNRASVRRFLGQLEGAEADLDAVVASCPDDGDAWHLRSDLRVQTDARNHVAALEERLRRGFDDWRREVPVRFALAKEYEDLGRYPDSWRALQAGAALRRRHLQYDVRRDLETVEWIREALPDTLPDAGGGECETPIFIVGMPRTGTTLLERILAGVPGVQAAGELNDFAVAVVAAARLAAGRGDLDRRALIAASARADFDALGRDYLARAHLKVGEGARFIDKMPLNYLYCGLIRRALPGARVLHVTRHPLATSYAVYKTLFAQGYPFSYDLLETADYFAGYRRLMEHWQQTLPGQIHEVSYERLVTDTAAEAARAFEFCGLRWDDRYLDAHRGEWLSTTASASQVRRPIYRRSLDLWRQYAADLAPVADRLAAAGIACPD